jgi:hypothetical protein
MTYRYISLAKLHAAKSHRKPGYIEAVMAVAEPVSSAVIRVTAAVFDRLRSQYSVPSGATQSPPPAIKIPPQQGPGTELKKLLASIGVQAAPTCACGRRADAMNERGCDWCEANLDTIVGWLREEATKRGLPFIDAAGRLLVKRAIRNARKLNPQQGQ